MYFWGKLTSMVKFALNDQLAYIAVPHALFAEYGVTHEDLEGFVERMRRVATVRMTLMMREEIKNGSSFIKVSMRIFIPTINYELWNTVLTHRSMVI